MYRLLDSLDKLWESIGFAVELAVTGLALLGFIFLGWCVKKGDKMNDRLMFFWALQGRLIGAILVLTPIVYDVVLMGAREWQMWKIDNKGVLCQLVGVACILLSWYCDESLR